MTNSKAKGARGEREWRDFLREHGFSDARRGRQYKGTPDSPDVECRSLIQFHFEVKRVEALHLGNAVKKAREDAGARVPVVAHKKNRKPWLVTMLAEDWIELVKGREVTDGGQAAEGPEQPPERRSRLRGVRPRSSS